MWAASNMNTRNEDHIEKPMQPMDDAMIDHLSQRKDTIRGSLRGSVKAGLNNDDIDDVVGDTHGTHRTEDDACVVDRDNGPLARDEPNQQDSISEEKKLAQMSNHELRSDISQIQSHQDLISKKTAMTDVTGHRSKQPDFVSHLSGHDDKESYATHLMNNHHEMSTRQDYQQYLLNN
jgi:hypothetical protein